MGLKCIAGFCFSVERTVRRGAQRAPDYRMRAVTNLKAIYFRTPVLLVLFLHGLQYVCLH